MRCRNCNKRIYHEGHFWFHYTGTNPSNLDSVRCESNVWTLAEPLIFNDYLKQVNEV